MCKILSFFRFFLNFKIMKKGIHPEYKVVRVSCACGNVFEVRSTYGSDYAVEICSACHPFYKGTEEEKLIDKFGMVEKFKRRYGDFSQKKEKSAKQ